MPNITLTPELLEKFAVTSDRLDRLPRTEWVAPQIDFKRDQDVLDAIHRLESNSAIQAVFDDLHSSATEYVGVTRELFRTMLALQTGNATNAVEADNAAMLIGLSGVSVPNFSKWARENLPPELRARLRFD